MTWGVEVEFDGRRKSEFHAARRVILDADSVRVQSHDGTYTAYPIGMIRKILSMRSEASPDHGIDDVDEDDELDDSDADDNDDDDNDDEIY